MNFLLRFLLISLAFALGVQAEPEKEIKKEKAPPRTIRFLPLGESPPFEQEVRNGVRYELEPPAGSIPPRQVGLTIGKEKVPPLRLSLGRISPPEKIPAGPLLVDIRRFDEGVDAGPWASLTLPETGNVLVLIWREPGQRWDKPRCLILPDGPEFKAGMLRLTNLSPVEVRFIVGEEKIALPPGKVHGFPIPLGRDVPLQIAWIDPTGTAKPIYSSAIVQNEGERGELIIYRADGEQPRQPLKVLPLRERAPEPPPAPR